MKRAKNIASVFGTLIIWAIASDMIICQLITVSSAYELLLTTLILIHATAATVAVWWMPRILHQRLNLGTTDPSASVTDLRFPGRPLHQSNSAFWWKLAFIAAIVNFAALPVWMFRYTGRWPAAIPIPLIVPISVFFALPILYLAVFSLWHWRTRYAGRHHLVWLILFIIAERPFVQLFPGTVFIALAYCAMHLVPDARGQGAYSIAPTVKVCSPATTLPKRYNLVKSACFVLGWVLVIGGVVFTAWSCVTLILIWNTFQEAIPYEVGIVLSESKGSALWVACQIAKTTSIVHLLCIIAAAVGAVLILISQRLRWRLMDEQERLHLKEYIQQ